jgi:hypothetical protein
VAIDVRVQYCVPVSKYDRHGLKKRERVLILTTGALYLLDPTAKDFKLKQRVSWRSMRSFTVTDKRDSIFIIRTQQDQEQQKNKDNKARIHQRQNCPVQNNNKKEKKR